MAKRWWMGGVSAVLWLTGCTNSSDTLAPPATYRVTGQVLRANGEPVYSGTVRFHAKDKPGNDAMGGIDKNGTFKLGTFSKDDGAVPGRYVVTVDSIAYNPVNPKRDPRVQIPKKYTAEETSPWTVEVKPEDNILRPFRLR